MHKKNIKGSVNQTCGPYASKTIKASGGSNSPKYTRSTHGTPLVEILSTILETSVVISSTLMLYK